MSIIPEEFIVEQEARLQVEVAHKRMALSNTIKRYTCAQSGHITPYGKDRPFTDGIGSYCRCGYKPRRVCFGKTASISSLFVAG